MRLRLLRNATQRLRYAGHDLWKGSGPIVMDGRLLIPEDGETLEL